MDLIEKQLEKLPDNPGIYLYYNKGGELVYVGKATSLRSRVRSYWRGQRAIRPIENQLHEVVDIKWIETDSVLEAIILEANYIRKHKPVYNVMGKDDKSWNYIIITKEAFPQVVTVRQHDLEQMDKKERRQFLYIFGPYPGLNTKATLKLLRRMFRFSSCQNEKRKKFIGKPCWYHQIGLCLGVCTGEITPKEYREKVIRPLAMFLNGRKKQVLKDFERQMKQAVKEENFEEAARLRDQLFSLQRIQDIALLNKSFVDDSVIARSQQATKQSVDGDKIASLPATVARNDSVRIEGYDISNLGATGIVGSMVVFTNGEPDKNEYRKFKIKTVEGQSDVDCLEEVLRRRLRHGEWRLPNVFLIDGGKPQVNRAMQVMKELGITIPLVGIAKGPERKRNDFFFGNTDRSFVAWVSEHKEVLIRVRDEAHRFAITYQRKLRKIR